MTRRRTGDWFYSAKAVEAGIAAAKTANNNEDRGPTHRHRPCPDIGHCDFCGADTGQCFYEHILQPPTQ